MSLPTRPRESWTPRDAAETRIGTPPIGEVAAEHGGKQAAVIAPPGMATRERSPDPKITTSGTAAMTTRMTNPCCTKASPGPSSDDTNPTMMNIETATRSPNNAAILAGRAAVDC